MQTRNKTIDVLRGLAIILMVIGHSGFFAEGRKFIYLFHMAAFFMVSGFLFTPKYTGLAKDLGSYLLKKVRGLWLPCFIWNAIYTLLNNTFIKWHIYSDVELSLLGEYTVEAHGKMSSSDILKNIVKGVVMSGKSEMGGAFWFLKTLFAVSVVFFIVDYVLHILFKKEAAKEIIHGCISLVFLLLGRTCSVLEITTMGIPIVFSSYCLFYLGYIIKKYSLMKLLNKWRAFVVSCIWLVTATAFGPSVSVGNNDYWQMWYLLVCSLAGWIFCYYLADKIAVCKMFKFVEIIGQHTLAIVILHFLCFKLVSLLQTLIGGYPMDCLSIFPSFNTNGIWWIAYVIVGIGLPVGTDILWKNVEKMLVRRKK